MTVKQDDAERVATLYATNLGVGPFIVDGCEFDETEERPFWRVFLAFAEQSDTDIGLPASLIVRVDALTGEASHISML